MTTTNKLASAAFIGLMTASLFAATPAFAGEHDKGSCGGKSGCKGEAGAEKAGCEGKDGDKSSCEGKDKEAGSCAGKSGCEGHDKEAGTEEKK